MSYNPNAFKEAIDDLFSLHNPESWDDLTYDQQNTLVSATIESHDVDLAELFTEYTDIPNLVCKCLTKRMTSPAMAHELIRDIRNALQEQIDNEIYDYHHSCESNQWKSELAREDERAELTWIRRAQFPSNI